MAMASPSIVATQLASPDAQDDVSLVAALRAGDESAFSFLVETYHARMLRVARAYISDTAVAEEIVQETWLRVLRSIGRFEARSTLKTWIFRILVNTALNWASRERRSIALSRIGGDDEGDQPAVEPNRFRPADATLWPGHWNSLPASWEGVPEARLLAHETLESVKASIEALPASQRAVVTMRDVEGWSAEEVCNAMQISESNQRVLLHRGRSRVRRALERYLTENQASDYAAI
jgi:RNA polymerase sigma-70 factor (ECF subfamily)